MTPSTPIAPQTLALGALTLFFPPGMWFEHCLDWCLERGYGHLPMHECHRRPGTGYTLTFYTLPWTYLTYVGELMECSTEEPDAEDKIVGIQTLVNEALIVQGGLSSPFYCTRRAHRECAICHGTEKHAGVSGESAESFLICVARFSEKHHRKHMPKKSTTGDDLQDAFVKQVVAGIRTEGIRHTDFASRADVSLSHWSNIMTGGKKLSLEVAAKLAAGLGKKVTLTLS